MQTLVLRILNSESVKVHAPVPCQCVPMVGRRGIGEPTRHTLTKNTGTPPLHLVAGSIHLVQSPTALVALGLSSCFLPPSSGWGMQLPQKFICSGIPSLTFTELHRTNQNSREVRMRDPIPAPRLWAIFGVGASTLNPKP